MKRFLAGLPYAVRIMFRAAISAVFVGIVLFVLLGLVKGCFPATGKPPTTTEAPWAIQTSSRYYFAKEFSLQEGAPTIRDYWTFDGKKYRFVEGTKSFPEEMYGKVAIIRRTGQ